MHFCRICRTEKDLKYTAKQLRRICKRQNKDGQKLLNSSTTFGNICHNCEERLHNYHRLDDDGSDVDVDSAYDMRAKQREDSPIIVDDDELLYNLFFNKMEEREKQAQAVSTRQYLLSREQQTLGSDGDTEIVEVLTSRESTPDEQKVIAIIDLELEDEMEQPKQEQKSTKVIESDDEEIVFCTVDPAVDLPTKKSATNKKTRTRKDENEVRLIASLSLISSDSEVDEKSLPACNNKTATITTPSHTNVQLNGDCVQQVLERIQTDVACPVCKLDFPASKRLVHHMRCKHRSYDGELLCERPRCAQDSAMTIRLRYLDRYTYYECQLCGRIDAMFKEHKEHVMEKHAAESKSLKDPMMKELKCPLCKDKCGTQYVLLCRHLLRKHTAADYAPHLREVTHERTRVWNTQKQKNVERSARVYQLNKRKICFFECKMCEKIVMGYLNLLQHLNMHSSESKAKKVVCAAQKTNSSSVNNSKTARKTKSLTTAVGTQVEEVQQQQPQQQPKKALIKQSKLLNKLVKQPKRQQKLRKVGKKQLKAAATMLVKVQPPLRQFPTQKYKCKYCAQIFKGFHRLNLHQISEHSQNEYQSCDLCTRAFTTAAALEQHVQFHKTRSRHRRKYGASLDDGVDENCNTNCQQMQLTLNKNSSVIPAKSTNVFIEPRALWLQDLMQLHYYKTTNATTK